MPTVPPKKGVAHRLTGVMNSERGQNLICIVSSRWRGQVGRSGRIDSSHGGEVLERKYCVIMFSIRGQHKFRSTLKRLRGGSYDVSGE